VFKLIIFSMHIINPTRFTIYTSLHSYIYFNFFSLLIHFSNLKTSFDEFGNLYYDLGISCES